ITLPWPCRRFGERRATGAGCPARTPRAASTSAVVLRLAPTTSPGPPGRRCRLPRPIGGPVSRKVAFGRHGKTVSLFMAQTAILTTSERKGDHYGYDLHRRDRYRQLPALRA